MNKKTLPTQQTNVAQQETEKYLKDYNETNLGKSFIKTVLIIIIVLAATGFCVYMALGHMNWTMK